MSDERYGTRQGTGQPLSTDVLRKIIFDVRNDAGALKAHHGIALAGVVDLQVMHRIMEGQTSRSDFQVASLDTCLDECYVRDHSIWPGPNGPRSTYATKEAGKRLYKKKCGGHSRIWEQRPFHPDLLAYAAVDLPSSLALDRAMRRVAPKTADFKARVIVETDARIKAA